MLILWHSHSWLCSSARHALLRFRSQSILSFLTEDSDAHRCGREVVHRWNHRHNYFLYFFLYCGERAAMGSKILFRNALAVAPSDPNIIYAGSGEGLQRPDLATGDGVYKSTDAGKTWTHLQNLRDAQQITAILVDPKDPNRVFVAAEGHPYGPNAERGVLRSTDGGQSFQKILYKDENTGAADLAFDPTNPQTIYAVLWAARVAPWEIRSGESFISAGSGIFKSTDGGNTWRPLTKGLPTAAEELGRIGIAVVASQPNRLYASIEAKRGVAGIYRSDDAGESWKQINSDGRIGGRGPGAMGIAVAPDNPEVIYVANTTTWKSTDGGKTFVGFKGAPGGDDYQRIWISAENPKIIALSSDQGAVISVNGGETWSSW